MEQSASRDEDGLDQLVTKLTEAAETGSFSGVVLLQTGDQPVFELAAGLADRAEERPNSMDTQFGTASVTKGFTALALVSMIEDGLLDFDSRIVDLVDEELTSADPAVTIEQLLGHASGVGDYIDEELLDSSDDYTLDVPMHTLLGPRDFVPILNRFQQVEEPGTRFRYNNSGFILLALAIECVSGNAYHDEVVRRVFEPAGMTSTGFLRSDQLPAGAALGYLSDGRTNVHHLPVIGTGDGGAFTTASDMMRFWGALLDGRIVPQTMVDRMTTPNTRATVDVLDEHESYGLGFWIGVDRSTVLLNGCDAGVSARTGYNRALGLRFCLLANNADDVWPLGDSITDYIEKSGGRSQG